MDKLPKLHKFHYFDLDFDLLMFLLPTINKNNKPYLPAIVKFLVNFRCSLMSWIFSYYHAGMIFSKMGFMIE